MKTTRVTSSKEGEVPSPEIFILVFDVFLQEIIKISVALMPRKLHLPLHHHCPYRHRSCSRILQDAESPDLRLEGC